MTQQPILLKLNFPKISDQEWEEFKKRTNPCIISIECWINNYIGYKELVYIPSQGWKWLELNIISYCLKYPKEYIMIY